MLGSSAVRRSEIAASSNPRRSRAALRACPPAHRRRFGAIQGDESNFSLRKLAREREFGSRVGRGEETWPVPGAAGIRRVRPFAAQEAAECSPLIRI